MSSEPSEDIDPSEGFTSPFHDSDTNESLPESLFHSTNPSEVPSELDNSNSDRNSDAEQPSENSGLDLRCDERLSQGSSSHSKSSSSEWASLDEGDDTLDWNMPPGEAAVWSRTLLDLFPGYHCVYFWPVSFHGKLWWNVFLYRFQAFRE